MPEVKSAAQVREELLAKGKERTKEENEQLASLLSVREKLELKLKTDSVKIPMTLDGMGEFSIPFRKLSSYEANHLQEIMDAQKAAVIVTVDESTGIKTTLPDKPKQADLENQMFDVVGDACLEPDMKADYWKAKQGHSLKDFFTIVLGLIAQSSMPDKDYMERITNFRKQ